MDSNLENKFKEVTESLEAYSQFEQRLARMAYCAGVQDALLRLNPENLQESFSAALQECRDFYMKTKGQQ